MKSILASLYGITLLVVCSVLAYSYFSSSYYSSNKLTSLVADPLSVQVISSPHEPLQVLDGHAVWAIDDPEKGITLRFQVQLPAGSKTREQAIYLSGFRQTAEVWHGNSLLARGGNPDRFWIHPLKQSLVVPLSRISTEPSSHVLSLDIVVRAAGISPGGLGAVYYGQLDAIDALYSRQNWVDQNMVLATIAILAALLTLLAIDSFYSSKSKWRLLLAVPHFVYALLCLPHLSFDEPLLWFKLYKLSTVATVICWAYFGLSLLSMQRHWVYACFVLLLLMCIPYGFIDDAHIMNDWIRNFHDPAAVLVGILCMLYVAANWRNCQDRLALCVLLFVSAWLSGAGLHDLKLQSSFNPNFESHSFPLTSLMVALVLFLWTAWEMLSRGKELESRQQEVLDLVVTRTQELEEAKVKLIQQQRYLNLNSMGAAISHEIRNPLGSLFNDFLMLKKRLSAVDLYEKMPVARMQRSLERIDDIVTNLANFTRKQVLNREPINYQAWTVALMNEPEVEGILKDVQVELRLKSDLNIDLDSELLRRSLTNLFENSARAMEDVELKKLTVRTYVEQGLVHTVVEDNGRGFDMERVPYLVEPLISGHINGLGLGLAIVNDVVSLHHGELVLENNAKVQGARVRFSLPISLV